MVKDLVCGMQVDEKYPPARTIYQEKEYLFCCNQCKAAFEKDPEKYLQQQEEDEKK
jgi:YHS domain-containing protein